MKARQQTEEVAPAPRQPAVLEAADPRRWARVRRIVQSSLWLVVIVTIFGGLYYPLLGFVVPVVMLAAMIGGFFRGRYVCGWLCPRGAFLERIMKYVSPMRKIPAWLRHPAFRWTIFGLLMGFMIFQITRNPSDPYHWGRVFVRICIITTGLGVVLAVVVHPRAWCSFCPMGTFQSAVGGHKSPLYVEEGCQECRSCERACPINLEIVGKAEDGKLNLRDCLKCTECQVACPKHLLHY